MDTNILTSGVETRVDFPKFLWRFLLKDCQVFAREIKKLNGIVESVLNSRKVSGQVFLSKWGILEFEVENEEEFKGDVMDRLLMTRGENQESLSKAEILEEIKMFFISFPNFPGTYFLNFRLSRTRNNC